LDETGDEYLNFGHFSDIVSAHSKDKSYFRVGLVWEEPVRKTKTTVSIGWLLTYVEEEGIPRLVRYTFCRAAMSISLRFEKSGVFFKTSEHPSPLKVDDIVNLLPTWIEEHSSKNNGYVKLVFPEGFPITIPPLIALSFVPRQGASSPEGKSKKSSDDLIALGDPEEVLFASRLIWLGPVRTKPKRTYDEAFQFSPEGEHAFYMIRRMLRSKKEAEGLHAFMQQVGKASGLFQDVTVKSFGRGFAAPFEVRIVLDGEALNLTNVGYGVSQSLPVLVELLAREKGTWFAIQQPEVHLHPRAQSALGDIVFETALGEQKRFLIETHSDFMVDRFRLNYKRSKRSNMPDSQILFFERKDKHNIVTPIRIGKSGDLPADQPSSYREFFIREQLDLLEM